MLFGTGHAGEEAQFAFLEQALRTAAPVATDIHRQVEFAGVAHVWGPAASFVCGERQEDLGGARVLGALVHEFDAENVRTTHVRPVGKQDLLIEPVGRTTYRLGQ